MDYIIETNFEGPGFVAVPNAVAQSGKLSPEALGVIVYLASLPRGFIVRVGCIQETFNIGKDKWQRIARELREAGAMDVQQVRGPGGRVIGRRVSVRWPDLSAKTSAATESRETRPSVGEAHRKPEKPAAGKPAKVSRKTRQTGPGNPAPYKEEKPNKQASPRPAARPPLGSGERQPVSPSDLTAFQRSSVMQDKTVMVGREGSRVVLASGSSELLALREAIRREAAESEGGFVDAERIKAMGADQ